MKRHLTTATILIALFAALGVPVRLVAQDPSAAADKGAQHHRYKLIDMGTFGGQSSYVSGDGNGTFRVLNNRGTLAGSADTSRPDPFPAFCFNEDCLVSHTFQWRNGVITDLGSLKDRLSSASSWVSANGLIAGVSENGQVDPLIPGFPELRAVLWRNGQIIDLGTLPEGGHESAANAVNSHSQVVGIASNKIPDPNSMVGLGYQIRAFFWENGAMQDMGTLGTGTDAQAVLLNEKGQAVGWSYIDASTPSPSCTFPLATHSFTWDSEHGMQDLGGFGGTCTIAVAINNRGQIVGESNGVGDQTSPAFIWEKGSFQALGGSLGGDFSGASAINEGGEAVGFAYLANDPVNGPYHAALWKHIGELTDLGTLGGDSCSFASSINDKTQVIGISIPGCTFQISTVRPFLWMEGSLYDLNELIPAGSSLHLVSVETINNRGEIAGMGLDASGNEHSFLLLPCHGENDCQEAQSEKLEAKPSPVPQPLQLNNSGTSIRQMLLRRPSNGSRFPGLLRVPPSGSRASVASHPGWQAENAIEIREREEITAVSSSTSAATKAANSCPAIRCSRNHTVGTLCGFKLCIPSVLPVYKAYDKTYGRACFYGGC